ncbi:squalene/phytoene synthase family protein [Synechococcus sp. FGCU-3]|jgi:hypothetical protein|nr:squalene/phytoene synthase family protein [Synechococcus sp. FGCU3]
MSVPIELTLNQKFEIERFNRAIDTTADVDQLRDIAKQLLQAWHTQKAATNWAIRQRIGAPMSLNTESEAP